MSYSKLSIQSAILQSFATIGLAIAETQCFAAQKNEDGTYDVPFSVTATGDKFDFKNDAIAATSADVSFEVTLTGCTYNDVDGWQWGLDGMYAAKGGVYSPSVILYNNGEQLNDTDSENCYAAGMSEEEDAELGKKLTTVVMQNVAERNRIPFFKRVLSECDAPT